MTRSTAGMAYEATRVFALSRALVFVVAVLGALALGDSLGQRNAEVFDAPGLTHALGDALLAPLARWDAVWFLSIAESGYDGDASAAFFPLYPLLVRGAGMLAGGSPGALLAAAYAVSLGCLLGALLLLGRLVELELGRRLTRPTLVLLALFPGSLFLGAPYSESLFLLVSVGAFYAARTGRFAWTGGCAAAAAATRSAGVLLLLPLAVLWWQSEHRRPRDAAWLLLGPAALGAYAVYLGVAHGDALAFASAQETWYREFAGPLGGAVDGTVAALDGARQLLSGSREVVYFERAGGDPFRVAGANLMLFGFLVFALCACAGVLRRLPLAYGVWVVAALALALSFPVEPQPLMSLPRFLAVLFPLFMWLALVCEERRITGHVAAASAIVLCALTAQFASWHFVS